MAKTISSKKLTRNMAAQLLTTSVGGNSIEYLEKETGHAHTPYPGQGRAHLVDTKPGVRRVVVVTKIAPRKFEYFLETASTAS